MGKLITITVLVGLLVIGCGVNKDYVAEQIAASEARTAEKVDALGSTADANAAEIAKLQALGQELSEKTDMAINKAAGFENYQIIWEGVINFSFDSDEIDDVAAQYLDEAGAKMEQYAGSVLELAGHTDRTGNAAYNIQLGERRAASAKRYLAENFGISLYRMFTISYGEKKPVALPDEQSANSKNRRVLLRVWGTLQ
jgi:outer membrane protein OmpA-like peptidoglycan-associated protein